MRPGKPLCLCHRARGKHKCHALLGAVVFFRCVHKKLFNLCRLVWSVMVLADCYAESHNFSFDEQSSAPLCMISGWSGPIWLVALYDLFDEDGLLFVWIILRLL